MKNIIYIYSLSLYREAGDHADEKSSRCRPPGRCDLTAETRLTGPCVDNSCCSIRLGSLVSLSFPPTPDVTPRKEADVHRVERIRSERNATARTPTSGNRRPVVTNHRDAREASRRIPSDGTAATGCMPVRSENDHSFN